MDSRKTYGEYCAFLDTIVEKHQAANKEDKRLRISFGTDLPSFVVSQLAGKQGSIRPELLNLNKRIIDGCMNCGKLPSDKSYLYGAALFSRFYGILAYNKGEESKIEWPSELSLDDLIKREPQYILEEIPKKD